MSVDRQSTSSHLHQWDIRQLNDEVIANISSQLYSAECGDIFFASQTTRGMETQRHQHDFLLSRWKCYLPEKFKKLRILLLQVAQLVRAPAWDTQVWRSWVQIPLLSTDYWAFVPQVCSGLPTNWVQTGAATGSLALKAPIFLSLQRETDLRF